MINRLIYVFCVSCIYLLISIAQENRSFSVILAFLPIFVMALRKSIFFGLNTVMGSLLFIQGSLGFLFVNEDTSTSGTSLSFQLPNAYSFETYMIFLVASYICFFFALEESSINLSVHSLRSYFSHPILEVLLLIPGFGVVASGGISDLINRHSHLYGSKSSIFTHIFSLLSLVAPAVLTFIGRYGSRWVRIRCFVYISLYNVLFFALGSRKLAFGLFLLFTVIPMASKVSRVLQFILASFASLAGISISLFLRGFGDQGLGPYLQQISGFDFRNVLSLATFGNLLGGFPITGISAFLLPEYPKWHVLVEINPLWGGPAGWYKIAQFHSINSYTPSSGLGDLWNYGVVVNLIFWVVANYFIRNRGRYFRSSVEPQLVLYAAYVLSLSYFSTAITQYSLRASLRSVYYVVFFDLVLQTRERLLRRSHRHLS